MSNVLHTLADLVIILAGVVMTAAGWNWIANNTWRKWREARLWKQADKDRKKSEALDEEAMKRRARFVAGNPAPAGELPPPEPEPTLFVTYQMEDGSHVDDFTFVTDLEWFDERDREVRLIKKTYRLLAEELVILPDPYPIEEEDDA